MIALEKSQTLKDEYNSWLSKNINELNSYFKTNPKSWIKQKEKEIIQGFIFPTSNDKCAYCERNPNDGGGNIELDHYHPKNSHREKVFEIDNLLPSCSYCNSARGKTKNWVKLLNPYIEKEIKEHLKLNLTTLELEGISQNGKDTIKDIHRSINSIFLDNGRMVGTSELRREYQESFLYKIKTMRVSNEESIFLQIIGTLNDIDPTKAITASKATIILTNSEFLNFVDSIKDYDIDKYNEIQELIKEKRKYCLCI